MRVFRTAAAVAIVIPGLMLAGCTSAEDGPDDSVGDLSPSASPTPEGPRPEDVVEERTLLMDGVDVSATVHPLVRAGDLVVLTVDYLAPQAPQDTRVSVGLAFSGVATLGPHTVGGLRLLDLGQGTIHIPGADADLRPVQADDSWESLHPGVPARMQLAYAAPPADTDHMTLLFPGTYLFRDVPVIGGEVPPPTAPATEADESESDASGSPSGTAATSPTPTEVQALEELDLPAVVDAATYPLSSYTWQKEGAATREEVDRIQIDVDSDVLFAVESADLSPDAQRLIDLAAEQLRTRGAGTVQVVGHTDSVSDDASNLDLSQRRAQTVADALGAQLDPETYPIEADGRGEAEPVDDNDSDEGRQRNRRVEVTLLAERQADTVIDASGELPPAPELTATGAEGVLVDTMRPNTVRAPQAEIVDGHLSVELFVTAEDDAVNSAFGPGFMNSVWDIRPDALTPPNHMIYGISLLQGRTAMTPLDYAMPLRTDGRNAYICACELQSLNRIDGGQTRSMTLVYPAVGEPTTITLENGGGLGSIAFRLTDIPVVPSTS